MEFIRSWSIFRPTEKQTKRITKPMSRMPCTVPAKSYIKMTRLNSQCMPEHTRRTKRACRTGPNAFVQHALWGCFAELPPLSMWRRYSKFPIDMGTAHPAAPPPLPTGQVDFAGDAPVLWRTAPAEFHESTHSGCTGGRHLVALEVRRRTVPHLVLKCEPRIQCGGGVVARVACPCTQTM